jgi:AbrB family looped-hinge helix DNA binding protein
MALAKLTTKGQVTIPKEIRESLKLQTGDKIEIVLTDDQEAVIRPVSKKVDEIFCRLHRPGRISISTADMDKVVKRKLKENYK